MTNVPYTEREEVAVLDSPASAQISDRKLARKIRRVSNAKTLGNNLINAALIEFNKQTAQARANQVNGGSDGHDAGRSQARISLNARVTVQAESNSNNIMLTVETPTGTFSSYV